jgi:uncharacterized protein (DUF2062 family)
MAAANLFRKRASTTSLRETLRSLAGLDLPPSRTALAAGVGLAVGFLPVAPLQTLLVLGLAFALRLNRVAAFAGSLVWQPFTAPFILGAEYELGVVVLRLFGRGGGDSLWFRWVLPAAVGAALLAPAVGLAGWAATYVVLKARSRQKGPSSVQQGGRP